ncbi:hypothetical protein MUG91_G7n50 [Manis pentadactyla]|nr:hypothetical protein MUG91_G7n50 [Manis pentadactyla]
MKSDIWSDSRHSMVVFPLLLQPTLTAHRAFRIMAYKMLQVALCSTLLIGVLGAPFSLDDSANQFLHLKRHMYLQDYWDPDHSPNMWGNMLTDQARETWTNLRTTAQYYLDMSTFTFDMFTAQ